MEELVQTGREEEEADQSDHKRVEETMEGFARTEKEVEEETQNSNEERVEEKNDAIKQLFEPEINARSISVTTVREKIFSDPILCNEDAKVYDKVRAQWRYNAKADKVSSTVILAPEKELAADRVDRKFNESNGYECKYLGQ